MISAKPELWSSDKTRARMNHDGEPLPRSVQIAGADPTMMALAARYNVDRGAQIIDINMGCPAKKVCNVMAGSALLKDESLVARILDAVVNAVSVPVTLKIRTGWDKSNRNAVRVAAIAEQAGIQALALHGRTRACAFTGEAEYDSAREVKRSVRIPVIANGDIETPQKAKMVLHYTGADGIMIGRGAQGNPWIFRQIQHYLDSDEELAAPTVAEFGSVLREHLHELYQFYGSEKGVRIARKHIHWYAADLFGYQDLRARVNVAESAPEQLRAVEAFLTCLASLGDRLTYDKTSQGENAA